jgi:hypothetical protein
MAIPKDATVPKTASSFFKPEEGKKQKVRVLSDFVIGWEGWKDGKPFRHEGAVCQISTDEVDHDETYDRPKINHFWAAAVWNYDEKRVQVYQITQRTVMQALKSLEDHEDWGDLKGYDITVTRAKKDGKTTYDVNPVPPKPLPVDAQLAYEEANVDLTALFRGEYPIKQ